MQNSLYPDQVIDRIDFIVPEEMSHESERVHWNPQVLHHVQATNGKQQQELFEMILWTHPTGCTYDKFVEKAKSLCFDRFRQHYREYKYDEMGWTLEQYQCYSWNMAQHFVVDQYQKYLRASNALYQNHVSCSN